MEDKRIKKTKKNLKAALADMLNETPFEQVTITELCRRSDISRITFYSHYSDKYALVDDIFQDMIILGKEEYKKLQMQNNPRGNSALSFCNVLDSILNLYYSNYSFFRHTSPDKNPHLAFLFYNYILETVETYTNKERRLSDLKYSARKIAGFLCYGMAGFINESHAEHTPLDQIRKEARGLLTSVLKSEILIS